LSLDWVEHRTSDLIDQQVLAIGDGYRAKNSELAATGIPFARAGNVDNGFHFEDADHFPEADLTKVGAKTSRPGDVVFTSKGTVGRFAFVRDNTPRFVYSPQLCYWRSLDDNVIDPRFLFYWMHGQEFRLQADGVKGQTDMADYVSLGDQRRMYLTLPSIKEQRAIARTLGALDDKIELNRRMNRTLEEMAHAIFKSWFVDFDPVVAKSEGRQPYGMNAETAARFPAAFQDSELGPIPKGWTVGDIGSIADVTDCLHSKKPDRLDAGKPLLQLWNIRDDGLIDMTDTYWISEDNYRLWTSRIEASPGDCVITNVGRVGVVAQIPESLRAALGRNMTAIRCKSTYAFPTFLIQYLLSDAMRNEINLKVDTGTILDALNVRNIPRLRLVLPSLSLLESFERVSRPLRAKMAKNLSENSGLATVRDTLLPKLLSGEIRVKDAAKFAEKRA
jgi:type I restriction enzyme S subunit